MRDCSISNRQTVHARLSVLCLALGGVFFFTVPHNLRIIAAEPEAAPKAERSQFGMPDVRDFISHTLSQAQPKGSVRLWGLETRHVRGRVVDYTGKPIEGAYVAFVEPAGFSPTWYDENFDRTDKHGRFLVEGDLLRSRLVVWRSRTQRWAVDIDKNTGTVDIIWPEPATVQITVDPELLDADTPEIRIQPTKYRGLTPHLTPIELDANNSVEVTDHMPGKFSVCVPRRVRIGNHAKLRYVEVGMFEAVPGGKISMHCRRTGNRRVTGRCPAVLRSSVFVTVDRFPTRFGDTRREFDLMVSDDGTFETVPLPPGKYVLRFRQPPPPKPPGNRLPIITSFRTIPTEKEWRYRIVVPEANEPLSVDLSSSANEVRTRIENILDSQGDVFPGDLHTDFGVVILMGLFDEESGRRELLSLFRDPTTPSRWKSLIRTVFGRNLDDDEVFTAMLHQLANAERISDRTGVLSEFRSSTTRVHDIVEAIAPYRHDDEVRIRWSALNTLGWLADKDDLLRPLIISMLIEATADPHDGIRSDIATALGRISAQEAVPALNRAIQDPVGKVRVTAAWALWRITRERERPIKLMTVRLRASDHSGKVSAARFLGEFDQLPVITIKQLRRHTQVDVQPPYRGENLLRFQLKNVALSTLKKVRPSDFESAVSTPGTNQSQKFD